MQEVNRQQLWLPTFKMAAARLRGGRFLKHILKVQNHRIYNIICKVVGGKLQTVGKPWCYEVQLSPLENCRGPGEWTSIDSCDGNEQSPINIVSKEAELDESLSHLKFINYDAENDFVLTNNGHSAELFLEENEITISEGGLQGTYKAKQLHFHWGNSGTLGSEHSKDGKRFAAELHIVHTLISSSRSESGGDITGEGRTIAVLAFFIEESEENNSKYDGIIQALNDIRSKDLRTTVSQVKLQELIPEEEKLKNFYRYDGSLTTPGCAEIVTWTVFYETIKLGKSQLEAFYTKLNYSADAVMVENFRPIQKLGVRKVYTSGVEAVVSHSRHLLLSFIVACVVLMF